MLNVSTDRIKEIELLDAMCGTGKSFNLFKYIAQNPYEHFLYVTPMLSEVASRPAEELAKFGNTGIEFSEPTGEGFKTKGDHLLDLLESRKNIICTHTLFQGLDKAGQQSIWRYGYTIIIDEELGMIEPLDDATLAREDRKLLFEKNVITTEADGRVVWHDEIWGDGNSAFGPARKLAEAGSLYSNKDGTFFNVQIPVEIIKVAKRVIVATYMFEGSVFQAFLKVKGISHKPFAFDGMQLRDERALKEALSKRIKFYDVPATTEKFHRSLKIPVDDLKAKITNSAFSTTWYYSTSRENIVKVGNHIRNVARQMDVKAGDLLYTLPSKVAGKRGGKWVKNGTKIIKVKGFSPENCFLHKGARATNDYAYKTAAIHVYNRYPHPSVKRYLQEQGGEVNDDSYALAELIQWFFRTAIRLPNGPEVKLHIASPRMERLFKDWLNS
jgi:hypothetical protein